MRPTILIICLLAGIALSTMFSDIFRGIINSQKPSISNFVKGLPGDLIDELKDNEEQAGIFICDIVNGDVPAVIEGLATEVWDEIHDDWSAVTDFVEALPSLAPAVLEDIVEGGEDVVSVVGEIFTNPGGALTLIESGAEVIISDITSVGGAVVSVITSIGGEIGDWAECFFAGNCPETDDPASKFMSSCAAIKAAATTTYVPVQTSMTDTYPSAVITSIVDTPPTVTSQVLAATSNTGALTTAPPISRTVTSTVHRSTSRNPSFSAQGGLGSSASGVGDLLLRTWFGLSVCSILMLIVL